MKRFGRFIILAVVGFTLGAGLAYFQGMQEAKKAAMDTTAQAPVVVETPSLVEQPAVPQQSASEMALNEGAADVAPAAGAEDPAAAADQAATTDQAVAGSSVGGAFSLTDHNGNAVTEASWPGKYKLVFFGFTHCPDICPATLDKITTALNAMPAEEVAKLQPLFITTDPARDDTETVKKYIAGYHPSIVGLTGTEAQLKEAEDAYKVFASRVPGPTEGDYTIEHSSYVFLMSPDDQLLEIFKTEDTAETIAQKTQQHIAAAPAPAEPAATEEGAAPGMKEGAPGSGGGVNETEVPGELVPEKPEALPEIMPENGVTETTPEAAPQETPAEE